MKALSLHQPHATAIKLGLKQYETRGWMTHYRGPLAIHAALKEFKYTDYDRDYFMEVCKRLKTVDCPHYALQYGRVLCVVDLVECIPTCDLRPRLSLDKQFWGDFRDVGDDGKQRFAFKLENVRQIWPHPKVKGMQRFFEIPDEVLKYV